MYRVNVWQRTPCAVLLIDLLISTTRRPLLLCLAILCLLADVMVRCKVVTLVLYRGMGALNEYTLNMNV